jgi:hypothetical protein
MFRSPTWFTLTVAVLTSVSIWLLTPMLTSHREPWDAGGNFYPMALLIAGAMAGAIAPKPLWAHYAGSYIGQLGYELLFLGVGPLVIVGAVFLLGYCGLYSIAAGVAGMIRQRVQKRPFSRIEILRDKDPRSNS